LLGERGPILAVRSWIGSTARGKQVETDAQLASARRLFGAYRRAAENFASDAEICA
jgi:hypothetical protein